MLQLRGQTGWDVTAFILQTVLTLLTGGILVAQANGYDIDFRTLAVEKTGLLVLDVQPASAQVFVDEQELFERNGERVRQLLPGPVRIQVTNADYISWNHFAVIDSGLTKVFSKVRLFFKEPLIIRTRSVTKNEFLSPFIDSSLRLDQGEIWRIQGETARLITRLSRPILSATMLDEGHVVFQIEREIHILDLDGSNDINLLTLESDRAIQLISLYGGNVLGVLSEGILTEYQIS
ncbi:hypothetical protein HYW32_03795 [Candidatus Berkelbacteria bacterium]|nr:hypothetical protein [Candidatus Berkelbacteria bacterium]